jgi:hypothetical protein
MGGSGAIQVIVNSYYCGQVVKNNGKWLFYLNARSELSSFEILIFNTTLLRSRLLSNVMVLGVVNSGL